MKRIVALALVLITCVSLCACGKKVDSSEEVMDNVTIAETQAAPTQIEAEEETPQVATEDFEIVSYEKDPVYAEDLFAIEDFVYEMFRDKIHNFKIKIRNTTSEKMGTIMFRAQALDAAGDVLDAWNIGSSDGLDAGQAFWFYCSNQAFDDCKTIEEASKKVDTIRIISATIWIESGNSTEYDFKEPYVIKVIDIKPKN